MPEREHTFARGEVYPSWFVNAMSAFLSTYAENFYMERVPGSDTQIRVNAGAGDELAAIGVQGRMRWVEADVVRAHPGGAAGPYDVYVVALDDVIVNAPLPNTDNTDRTFDLRIVAAGAVPAVVGGSVEVLRGPVATLDWDGTKITRFTQIVGDVASLSPRAAGFSTTVGNGVATSFDVAHGLNSSDLAVSVTEIATGELVLPDVFVVDTNTVRLIFGAAPAAASHRVSILAATTSDPVAPVGVNSSTIGDGAGSVFVVNHGLGTRDVNVDVFRNVAPFDTVDVDIERTDANTLTIRTPGYVPALNELRVITITRAGLQGAAAQHGASHAPGGSDPIPLPAVVTVLPATPVDGQEVYFLADAANGVVWHLRYRAASASAYKWEVLGQPAPLYAADITGSIAVTAAYVDLLSVTLPLAGDYDFDWAAHLYWSNSAANPRAFLALTIGAEAGDDSLALIAGPGFTVPAGQQHDQDPMTFRRRTGIAAGAVAKVRGRYDNQAPTTTDRRVLRARPVRVG